MSILIGSIEFEDTTRDLDSLKDEPGYFAILEEHGEDAELLELGECESLRSFLKDRVQDLAHAQRCVAVHYTAGIDEVTRKEVTSTLEREFACHTAA